MTATSLKSKVEEYFENVVVTKGNYRSVLKMRKKLFILFWVNFLLFFGLIAFAGCIISIRYRVPLSSAFQNDVATATVIFLLVPIFLSLFASLVVFVNYNKTFDDEDVGVFIFLKRAYSLFIRPRK
ncbi:MAG: hypothetical protein AAF224_08505 [Pseudomonadota bacterium]